MARIFLDEIGGLNSGILGSYGLVTSPFSTEDYATPVTEIEVKPVHGRQKQSKPKPKRNDGIIRNHDSVWDYKIQDGKLLTRRKGNKTWIDISDNTEAVNRIQQFTGKSISTNSNSNSRNSNNTNNRQILVNTEQPEVENSTLNVNRGQNVGYLTNQFVPQAIQRSPNFNVDDYINGAPKETILSNEDLKNRNWHWGGVDDITYEGVPNSLYADAVQRAQTQGRVLLDSKGRPVTNRDVRLYKNYTPADKMSAYDAQFYQPQSENSTLKDIRKAQDFRRNRDFDRQRNEALALMFGLPVAGIGGAEALMAGGPLALAGGYLGSDLGGKITNAAMQKIYGRTWDEISDDPNVNFYAQLVNPGRLLGGYVGYKGGSKLWNERMIPVSESLNGEPEVIADGLGIPAEVPSTVSSNRFSSVLLNPEGQGPAYQGIAPGYAIEVPNRTITVNPSNVSQEPLWYDNRFMQTSADMQAGMRVPKPKKSIKTTKGTKAKSKTKSNKKSKKQIVNEAYEKAYQ